jgi:hypothetical protein
MHNRGARWVRLRRALSGRLAPGLALVTLAACEVPTSLPNWDTVWIAPGKSTTIPVASLLPSQVSSAPGGDAFLLSVAPIAIEESLAESCPSCSAASGSVVPKPAFTVTATAGAPLPTEVISAELASGTIDVALRHDYGFDPLRPSSTARGYLVLEARSGSTTLVHDSISGADVAWAPGTTLTRALALGAGAISGAVDVDVTLYSPAGDAVRIDTNQALRATVTPSQLHVSQAKVRVADQSIVAEQVELDLADIDQAVVDHQKGGALLLDVTNPFDVTGTLTLTLTAPGVVITKPVVLQAGSSTSRVELTEPELGSILGASPVHLSASGAVSAPAGGATVRPSQGVEIASRLEFTIGAKEQP